MILDLDLEQVDATDNFDLLPPGKYNVYCQNVEAKTSSKGGLYLNCTFEVGDAAFAGRNLWYGITITNDNPKAVEMGMKSLKQLLACAGQALGKFSGEFEELAATVYDKLYDKPLIVSVKIDKDTTGQYSDKNKVSRVHPAEKTLPVKGSWKK